MNKTNIKIQHGEKIDDNIKTTQNSPMPHVPFYIDFFIFLIFVKIAQVESTAIAQVAQVAP